MSLKSIPQIQPRTQRHILKNIANFYVHLLDCIKTTFCKKIYVCQHLSSFTRCAHFYACRTSAFSQSIDVKKQQFWWKFTRDFPNILTLHSCKIYPNFKHVSYISCCILTMLRIAYSLTKIDVNTTENEKVCRYRIGSRGVGEAFSSLATPVQQNEQTFFLLWLLSAPVEMGGLYALQFLHSSVHHLELKKSWSSLDHSFMCLANAMALRLNTRLHTL